MALPARTLLLAGLGTAAVAVAAAVYRGDGEVDAPSDPAGSSSGKVVQPGKGGRSLPPLAFPPGFPAAAAEILEEARTGAAGGDAPAAAALQGLAEPGRRAALRPVAAEALATLLPCLAILLDEPDGAVAGAALRATAALALDGGERARGLLDGSGFVLRSLVPRALSGSPGIREETARLLGFVGGRDAGDRLVLMLADAEPAVTAAAALALGDIGDRERRLPDLAPTALIDLFDGREEPAVRRACLIAFRRAHRLLAPYGAAEREARALRSPDAATRLEAALNQQAHPADGAAEALMAALEDPDPRIVEPVADALGALLDARAVEPLRRRRASLADPAALRAVDAAVARLEGGR